MIEQNKSLIIEGFEPTLMAQYNLLQWELSRNVSRRIEAQHVTGEKVYIERRADGMLWVVSVERPHAFQFNGMFDARGAEIILPDRVIMDIMEEKRKWDSDAWRRAVHVVAEKPAEEDKEEEGPESFTYAFAAILEQCLRDEMSCAYFFEQNHLDGKRLYARFESPFAKHGDAPYARMSGDVAKAVLARHKAGKLRYNHYMIEPYDLSTIRTVFNSGAYVRIGFEEERELSLAQSENLLWYFRYALLRKNEKSPIEGWDKYSDLIKQYYEGGAHTMVLGISCDIDVSPLVSPRLVGLGESAFSLDIFEFRTGLYFYPGKK